MRDSRHGFWTLAAGFSLGRATGIVEVAAAIASSVGGVLGIGMIAAPPAATTIPS
jgi:hypothetical protein